MNKVMKKFQKPVIALELALALGSPFYKAHAKNDTLKFEVNGQKQQIVMDEKTANAAKEGLNSLLNSVSKESTANSQPKQNNAPQSTQRTDAQSNGQTSTVPNREEGTPKTNDQTESDDTGGILVAIGLGLGTIGFIVWKIRDKIKEKNDQERHKEWD